MNNLPSKNSTSTSLQIRTDRTLSDLVAFYANQTEKDGPDWTLPALPTTAERRSMEARQADVNRALRPVSMADSDKAKASIAITAMLAAWIHSGRADPKSTVSAYLAHLSDMPLFAIEEACRAVARGYVDGLSPDFPPSAARLHQLAVDACEKLSAEQASLRKVLSAKQHYVPTAEERARVAENFKGLTESLKAGLVDPAAESRKAEAARRSHEATTRRVLQEYAELGIEPLYCGDILVSPALLKQLGRLPQPKSEAAE